MTRPTSNWVLATLLVTLLSSTPLSADQTADAQKGNNGWLIYTGAGGNLQDYLHTNTLTEQHLSYLVNKLTKIDSDFRQRGGVFLWVVPPNTPTIYPESMPARHKPVGPNSKLEQLNAAFGVKGITAFVDLTKALSDERKRSASLLYRKTDTHWTDVGAFIGYREIMRRMAESQPAFKTQLEPMTIEAFALSTRKDYSGDLAGMLGLKGDLTEDIPELKPKSARSAAVELALSQAFANVKPKARVPAPPMSIEIVRPGVVAVNNSARCPGPSLVMYHDSYGIRLAEWMVEHFCHATFYYPTGNPSTASFDREMLMQAKPAFFVLESVERFATEQVAATILDELFALEPPAGKPQPTR